jgi:hypothetical protein
MGILAALSLTFAALIFAYPATAAIACPQCFGFASAGDGLFVDRGMDAETRSSASAVVEQARQNVGEFYGGLKSHPLVFACATPECYRRLHGGGSRGMAILSQALVLSPRGLNVTIATHELSHIELHRRIGTLRAYRGAIPAWFDEGLAVIVSDDTRYLKPEHDGDRCRQSSDQPLPETQRAWLRPGDDSRYAVAACRVSRWMATHGGGDGVLRLVARIADGEDFATAAR